jgi:2-iminobutanoate/2-iminopropanoate deaminase
MPTDPAADARPLPDGIAAQTLHAVENLRIVLASAGCGLEHVVQAQTNLAHFERDYTAMNEVWRSLCPADRLPAHLRRPDGARSRDPRRG